MMVWNSFEMLLVVDKSMDTEPGVIPGPEMPTSDSCVDAVRTSVLAAPVNDAGMTAAAPPGATEGFARMRASSKDKRRVGVETEKGRGGER